ncbi:MAG: hypothetical protein ACRENO_09395, partial [Thermodesulfobacteriota bacterium]
NISEAAKSYYTEDIASLSSIIKNLYENRESLQIARKHSWEYGSYKYNWDLEKLKFLNLVDKVLD